MSRRAAPEVYWTESSDPTHDSCDKGKCDLQQLLDGDLSWVCPPVHEYVNYIMLGRIERCIVGDASVPLAVLCCDDRGSSYHGMWQNPALESQVMLDSLHHQYRDIPAVGRGEDLLRMIPWGLIDKDDAFELRLKIRFTERHVRGSG